MPAAPKTPKPIKTIELFAGVGGFRLGLEGLNGLSASSGYTKPLSLPRPFEVVWSNQWEPSTKRQHASEVYEQRWGTKGHSNEDIGTVLTSAIPDHDLLVGGFPCQDYSVAATLNRSGGIDGKKGVLWWQIYRILFEKGAKKPRFLFLENVDRLLKSPANQRGRDFAIMLACLANLGYVVEWRVVNAADYGMPQRRRRTFIVGYLANSKTGKAARKDSSSKWVHESGIIARALPVQPPIGIEKNFILPGRNSDESDKAILEISRAFGTVDREAFDIAGVMKNHEVHTFKTVPAYTGQPRRMGELLESTNVPEKFFIPDIELPKWQYLKGSKSETRITAEGFEYKFTEGGIAFPDSLDKPFRTIITGEGGAAPSRFKHVIRNPNTGQHRRLTPVELERANMFPDDHTSINRQVSDGKRAFLMGNALVVGVIEAIGEQIANAAS